MTTDGGAAPALEIGAVPPGSIARGVINYATTADGVVQGFPLIVVSGALPGPTAVFVSGIHGDEYEGPAALWRLAERLDPKALTGQVLIVPIANPPAFAAGTRTSPVDNENLARIFPGDARGTLSHRLADALMQRVISKADFLIDSHSGGVRLAFVPVAGFYEEGEVSRETAQQCLLLAKQMGIDFLWQLPPVDGVLSYEAAKRGIPVCGAEIGGRGNCLPADAELYLAAYLSVLAHRGMIADSYQRPFTSRCLEGGWEKTEQGGYLETVVPLGAELRAGNLVARLREPLGRVLRDFVAPFEGRVMAVRHLNAVQPGDLAICVVREGIR
ncbi:MAG: succinylglutamate desuccinylase/aspartoacylase family protein [Devosia sp.]|nr:succinylglutamate desuccinylase/aspartoacylase family protein [Devosia sp.]